LDSTTFRRAHSVRFRRRFATMIEHDCAAIDMEGACTSHARPQRHFVAPQVDFSRRAQRVSGLTLSWPTAETRLCRTARFMFARVLTRGWWLIIHFGGYPYDSGRGSIRYFCLILVRPASPPTSGCPHRACLLTSQNRFWQSTSCGGLPTMSENGVPAVQTADLECLPSCR